MGINIFYTRLENHLYVSCPKWEENAIDGKCGWVKAYTISSLHEYVYLYDASFMWNLFYIDISKGFSILWINI